MQKIPIINPITHIAIKDFQSWVYFLNANSDNRKAPDKRVENRIIKADCNCKRFTLGLDLIFLFRNPNTTFCDEIKI